MFSPWRINPTHEAAQKDLAEVLEAMSYSELSAAQIASKCRIATHRIRLLLAPLIESHEVLTRRVKSPNKSGHLVYRKAENAARLTTTYVPSDCAAPHSHEPLSSIPADQPLH